jgi:hypothetical protein
MYFPFTKFTADSASELVIRDTFRSPERDNIPTESLLFLLAKRHPSIAQEISTIWCARVTCLEIISLECCVEAHRDV